MQIVYRLRKWEKINHDGRAGSDAGVDIRSEERLENGAIRIWFVQCRRYKKVAARELKTAVNDTIAKSDTLPDVLLVIVGCDVSLKARSAYENYAKQKGIRTPFLWQASTLETMLYSDYPDLLFAFFGISIAKQERTKEAKVKRNLSMKRKLTRILRPFSPGRKLIFRSIDDEIYPEVDDNPSPGQMSSWFSAEYYGFYHNGIEIVLGIDYIVLERDIEEWRARWAIVNLDSDKFRFVGGKDESGEHDFNFYDHIDQSKYAVRKAYRIGRIPYRNIIECDEFGDEYYNEPHFYCDFAEEGSPYETIISRVIDGYMLESKLKVKFSEFQNKPNTAN